MATINHIGQRFGRLVVVGQLSSIRLRGGTVTVWDCQCDCGSPRAVRGPDLRNGKTRSCGCLSAETSRARHLRHGAAIPGRETGTYVTWKAMHQRCSDPKHRFWHRYGGRGISVCERWSGVDGFKNFLADMGERPRGRSLDRFPNNNGNYEPGNCRWATAQEQAANRAPWRRP